MADARKTTHKKCEESKPVNLLQLHNGIATLQRAIVYLEVSSANH